MFDTMTVTKAAGAICSALLVFLLAGWAAESLYDVDHHGADHVSAYRIAVPEAGAETEVEEVVEVPFEELYAVADAAAGEGLWRQCSSCHSLNAGQNGVGPYLAGIVDRPMHAAQGFGYSDGLLALEGSWTPEVISGFIANPSAYAPGTAMSYRGMSDAEDRANLIAWLATQ